MRHLKNSVWMCLKRMVGIRLYEKIRAYYNLGYWPNFHNPKTFNEHIMHNKHYADTTKYVELSDKLLVRSYVEKKVGLEVLTTLYYSGEHLSKDDFDNLPPQFVLKGTHTGGSENIVFIRDKTQTGVETLNSHATNILKSQFGSYTNEFWYQDIKPRILVEELMLNEHGHIPEDFKLFCFNGTCKYIQVDIGRYSDHKRTFYDRVWKRQNFGLLFPQGPDVEKPCNLEYMINVAEKLSEGFDFVRVDLYSFNEKVRFGELTFAPGSGWEPFNPKEIDYKLGQYF